MSKENLIKLFTLKRLATRFWPLRAAARTRFDSKLGSFGNLLSKAENQLSYRNKSSDDMFRCSLKIISP